MTVRFPRWLDGLLHIHDSPERTAFAFALGVFFGFSPLLGLHTVLGLAFAFLLRLNRLAVLIGVYSNTPWFIAPYYALATWVGAWLLNTTPPAGVDERLASLFELSIFSIAFWHALARLLQPWLWPFTVGSTLGALLLSFVAYRVVLAAILARRRMLEHTSHTPS